MLLGLQGKNCTQCLLAPSYRHSFVTLKVPKICHIGAGGQRRSYRSFSRITGCRRLSMISWMGEIILTLSEQDVFRRTILFSCYLLTVPSSTPTKHRIVGSSSGSYLIMLPINVTRKRVCFQRPLFLDRTNLRIWTQYSFPVSITF